MEDFFLMLRFRDVDDPDPDEGGVEEEGSSTPPAPPPATPPEDGQPEMPGFRNQNSANIIMARLRKAQGLRK